MTLNMIDIKCRQVPSHLFEGLSNAGHVRYDFLKDTNVGVSLGRLHSTSPMIRPLRADYSSCETNDVTRHVPCTPCTMLRLVINITNGRFISCSVVQLSHFNYSRTDRVRLRGTQAMTSNRGE